jgi:hypothetical protein
MFRQVGADMADPTKNLKQIVFDRNERFLHWMNRVYTAPATRRAWWVPFVAGITAGDSSLILPLQAADVLAWVVGRQQAYADCPEWHATLTVGYPTKAHAVYDCASLVDEVWI